MAAAESSLTLAAEQRSAAEAASVSGSETLKTARARVAAVSAELDKVVNTAHGTEISRNEHRLRLEQLASHAADEYGIEPDALAAEYGPDTLILVPADSLLAAAARSRGTLVPNPSAPRAPVQLTLHTPAAPPAPPESLASEAAPVPGPARGHGHAAESTDPAHSVASGHQPTPAEAEAEGKPGNKPAPSRADGQPEAEAAPSQAEGQPEAEAAPSGAEGEPGAKPPLSLAEALRAVRAESEADTDPETDTGAADGDGAVRLARKATRAAEPAPAEPVGVPYIREEQQARAAEAERQLARLGKVNPLALEEYAALQERHQFLATQLDDLRKTRRDLLMVVKEVDDRVQEVFASAYADTAREFEGLFARLFPGGSGRLILTEPDDMLTTGIEIEARPPGKKVKRLSLLSGGERSLTAIAYLFAIFKARPSPFYVLDEVEAALDDSNLQRLLGVFTELQESSQLIVITHQRRTMEAADALYGVSMRGDGVSQVISQRIREREPA
jgi:chromosome segregation ATPase